MREHSGRLQKRAIYLTFDLERDYVRTGYMDPSSFEGLRHNVPCILNKMDDCQATGTFFVTPEVLEKCEDLVKDIRKRHAVGLHSHVYYQPEFKGWQPDGDSFKKYASIERERMILRDLDRYSNYLGEARLFRIGRLEPNDTVLRAVSETGCICDSSYHASDYGTLQKLRVVLFYGFQEVPVNFHLYGLRPIHLQASRSVILIHPLTPPGKDDPQVYDENTLSQIMEADPQRWQFKNFEMFRKESKTR